MTSATGADLRTPFFDVGLQILGEHGYAGLKQAALCSAVGVTTGAFYHSFQSWKDFTTQLLDFWIRERTVNLVALAEAEPDPVERLLLLLEVSLTLPHQSEAAIRTWSAMDPEVAVLQSAVDHQRFAVVKEAFRHMVSEDEAASYAQTGLTLLIGFEQQPGADPQHLRWGLQLLLETARGPESVESAQM